MTTTSDDVMPNPVVWPECPECHVTWIIRRAYVIGGGKGWTWVWQVDCKHKKMTPRLMNADGPVPEPAP